MSAPVAHDDFFLLLQIARFGACATRRDGTVVFWNRRAEQIAGVRSSQALGRQFREIIARTAHGAAHDGAAGIEAPGPSAIALAGQPGDALVLYLFDGHDAPARQAPPPGAAPDPRDSADPPPRSGEPDAQEQLTRREAQVLRMTAWGLATDQIASDLDISVHTVRNHVRSLRRKLDAKTKFEAVANAFRQGLL